MKKAFIKEIFASVQGEGPWAGQRHIFIRFIGCDLRCGYCDTLHALPTDDAASRTCSAQLSFASPEREQVVNPVSSDALSALCERLRVRGPARPIVSLTGGEPLLHAAFLREWLPRARQTFGVYLETNGVNHAAMREIASLIDTVSMDMKLPSATGQPERWDDHRLFLDAAGKAAITVKAVITRDTTGDDLMTAVRLTAAHDRAVPFIIQPVSGNLAPAAEALTRMQNAALSLLEDVRVIPQLHKVLGLP
jgi:7-carboxy-7-deazaguanine synthase